MLEGIVRGSCVFSDSSAGHRRVVDSQLPRASQNLNLAASMLWEYPTTGEPSDGTVNGAATTMIQQHPPMKCKKKKEKKKGRKNRLRGSF